MARRSGNNYSGARFLFASRDASPPAASEVTSHCLRCPAQMTGTVAAVWRFEREHLERAHSGESITDAFLRHDERTEAMSKIDPRSYEALGSPFEGVDGEAVTITAGEHQGERGTVLYQTGYGEGGVCVMIELEDGRQVEVSASSTDLPDD